MGNDKSTTNQQKAIQKLRKQLQQKNNHLNQLKKQNQTLVKQQFTRNKQNNELTVDTLMHMNYSTFTCINCQNFFDQKQRIPIMICKNQHTICEACCKEKQQRKEKKCLQCDQVFKNMGKNRSVLNLITNKGDLVNWVKQRDAQVQEELKNVGLETELSEKTIVHLCRFPGHETMFEMNNDSLLKISAQDSWHTIRSFQALPPYHQAEVTFKIIQSVHNSIIFGITTQTQQFQKGFIPSKSIAFHLNNGHIYDQVIGRQSNQNNNQNNGFKWRNGGTPVTKNTKPRIVMNVNLLSKKIKWKADGKVYAQTTVGDKFLTQKVYVFVAIYHKGDMIVLNK